METEQPASEMTTEELDTLLAETLDRSKQVEVQLGQPRKFHADGSMYNVADFYEWRRSAKFAQAAILARYRELKAERKKRGGGNSRVTGGQSIERTVTRRDALADIMISVDQRLERTNELLERLVALIEETD